MRAAMHKALVALAAALLATPALADTLIGNANGIQVGADGRLQRFSSLLIGDDGKVVGIYGKGQNVPLAKVGTRIDAGGRTLLPGLIDAHGHVMGLGLGAMQLDLTGTASLAELQERLRRYAADNPGTGWLTGRGWNQELWPGKRMPTAADLDAVVRDRPVWLERIDGHASVGNSVALQQAGITAATASPTGGKIEKDSAGRPTGLFIDTAAELVSKRIPATTRQQREQALVKAQQILLGFGVTSVADMGTSVDDWTVMRDARDRGSLDVRIMAYASGVEGMRAITSLAPTPSLIGDRLWLQGVKIYADGALGSRGAWLKRPYADAPATSGLRFLTDEELKAQVGAAAAKGLQPAVHAIGDAANAQAIRTFEELSRTHKGDRRWRIEHFQIADPADIPRLARTGIIASMQPTHQTSDRTMAEARLGPNRLGGAYAWQSVLRSGARIAFGSDFPVESANPFPGLAAAISRQDMNGQPPGGWLPHERVSFAQALSGFTRDAAYAGFAERRIGSLEPGKWADFIIVDRDVSAVTPLELGATRVIETWVGGRQVAVAGAPAGPSGPGERGR
jgi:predicted amidohydrolase YtcJ